MTRLLTELKLTETRSRLEYSNITEHIVNVAEQHRFTFDEVDDFELLIGKNIKNSISSAVYTILYKTYNTPISDELVFIHMQYHFIENHILHILNKKEPRCVNIDIAKLIIEQVKEYLLTGNLSNWENNQGYFAPSFGTLQEWTSFVLSIYEMYQKGNFSNYNKCLEVLTK